MVDAGDAVVSVPGGSVDEAAASPYAWFILVGFLAGALFKVLRIRSRARSRRTK